MANKSKRKYTVLLVIFTILLFISVAVSVVGFSSIARDYKYRSLNGRLESIERDERMHGPASMIGTINLDKDYEREFDYYWEFADIYREFVKGRFLDDPSESLKILKAYESNCNDENRKEAVNDYINIIEGNK